MSHEVDRQAVEAYIEATQRCTVLKEKADVAVEQARRALLASQEAWRACKGVPYGAYVFPEYGVVVVVGRADYPELFKLVK